MRHKTDQNKIKLALGPDYLDRGLVFPLEDGSPWPPDSFTTCFRSLRISLGLKPTFHDTDIRTRQSCYEWSFTLKL